MTNRKTAKNPAKQLREYALTLPGAWEDYPWGDTCAKVGKRIFVFLGDENLTVKLIEAHEAAMSVDGAVPTGYGMGKAGWVTLPLDGDLPPLEILCDWIDESYRLIAPKKLIAELDAR